MNEKKTFSSFIKANAMQLLSLIMLCLATYITLRLAPLSQDMALMRQQVNAIDEVVKNRISKDEVEIWFSKFDSQLTRMEGKVDYLYQIHIE
jgi:hypothetical protein